MITIPADSRAPRSQPGESLRHQYFDVRATNPPVLYMTTIRPKIQRACIFLLSAEEVTVISGLGSLRAVDLNF